MKSKDGINIFSLHPDGVTTSMNERIYPFMTFSDRIDFTDCAGVRSLSPRHDGTYREIYELVSSSARINGALGCTWARIRIRRYRY